MCLRLLSGGEAAALLPGPPGVAFLFARDVATAGPFLHLADFSSPRPNGLWQDLTVLWSRGHGPLPSFTYTSLSGLKSGQDWAIVARGSLEEVRLPDLLAAAGIMALPRGDMRLYSLHVLMDNFNFDSFDINSFFMSEWRSFAVHQFVFSRP